MTNVTDISNNVSKVFDNESYYAGIESIVDHELMSIIVPIVFVWLMLIGVTGNATLVYIILREKSLRTVPNALIVNLSIGDLLLLIFSAPFFAIVFGSTEYPFEIMSVTFLNDKFQYKESFMNHSEWKQLFPEF
jgi:hypothetical protein